MNKTFLYASLGCKVNQYEIFSAAALFQRAGFRAVKNNADVCIVNTCCVTGESEAKSRRLLNRLRRENPRAVIAVTGCFSQINPKAAELCGKPDIIVPNQKKDSLFEIVCSYMVENKLLSQMPALCGENMYIHSERTRATVKVQDGCNNFCSYCIIPYARGGLKSKPVEEAVGEITALAKEGYREVVLTGIHLTRYGADLNGEDLVALIENVSKIEGIERIRLGSLEPGFLNEERVLRLKNISKLCPHFHLALQSGSSNVLKAMNRHYTAQEYINEAMLLKKHFENCALTTDIMVGFPTETDADFNESVKVAKKVGFCKIHVFTFSARKGTPAYDMPAVKDSVKKQRRVEMLRIARECEEEFLQGYIGKTLPVLFESRKNGVNRGFTKNYIHIEVQAEENLENKIKRVKITEAANGVCKGILMEN